MFTGFAVMKTFLSDLFTSEKLAQRAFFSTLLATLGTWCVAAWMACGGKLIDFSGTWKVSPLFGTIFALFFFAAVVFNLVFFYSEVPGKLKKWFLAACGVSVLAVSGVWFFWGITSGCYTFAALFFWGLPLAVFYKRWYWVIPGSICYTIAAVGVFEYCFLLGDIFHSLQLDVKFFSDSPHVLWKVSSLFAALASNVLFYAAVNKSSVRKFFSLNMYLVFVIWAVTYGTVWCMYFSARHNAAKETIALEHYSGTTADASGLRTLYHSEEKFPCTGESFYQKVETLQKDFRFWLESNDLYSQYRNECRKNFESIYTNPLSVLPDKIKQQWKTFFLSSQEVKQLEKLFSEAIPLYPHTFKNSFSMELPELKYAPEVAAVHLWSIRFALEQKDLRKAKLAFDGISSFKKIIKRIPLHAAQRHVFYFTQFQLFSIVKMLESGLLLPEDLENYLRFFEAERKALVQLEKKTVFGETVMRLMLLDSIPQIQCFPFPPVWDLISQSVSSIAFAGQAETFSGFAQRAEAFREKGYCRKLMCPAFPSEEYRADESRLLILETLLKLEVEKRRSGKYPDMSPPWLPKDPVNGRKLNYRKGNIKVMVHVYDPETQRAKRIVKQVNAVAVWSSGKDLRNTLAADPGILCGVIKL